MASKYDIAKGYYLSYRIYILRYEHRLLDTLTIMTANTLSSRGVADYDTDMESFCVPLVHPDTGKTITNYKKLTNVPVMKEIWTKALGNEIGSLTQADDLTAKTGTDSLFVLDHEPIKNIPSG